MGGKVMIDGEEIEVELTATQKYSICKHFWASTAFSLEDKKALRDKALDGDDSDMA